MLKRAMMGRVVAFLAALCCIQAAPTQNDRPIIGILSQPTQKDVSHLGHSQIYASYAKWVETAGARAAVIPYDADEATVRELVRELNGIVFQGGATSLVTSDTQYYLTAKVIYEEVLAAGERGEVLPLWGTCLGLELLLVLTTGDHGILRTVFDAENLSLPLNFTANAETSRMYGAAFQLPVANSLSSQAITSNEHTRGITPKDFQQPALSEFYSMLSTSQDRNGIEFVSSFEAKRHSIYAVQYHPEKALFEWPEAHNTSHTQAAADSARYLASVLGREARRSFNSFFSRDVAARVLLERFPPVYTGALTDHYIGTMYIFDQWKG